MRAKGSATVELSILMPMICVLIIVLMYMGFYLYDRTVMYADAYLAALYGVENPQLDNEEAYEKAAVVLSKQMEGQLIALPEPETEICVTYEGIEISFTGEVEVPVIGENSFFSEWRVFAMDEAVSALRHRPVTFIRQCRKLERLVEESKDGESDDSEGNSDTAGGW